MYNPKSLKAEEFINDGEILDTIAYAEANKLGIHFVLYSSVKNKTQIINHIAPKIIIGSAF